MRGTIISSSRAFTGGSLFGKGAATSTPATIMKENKSNSSVDHVHAFPQKRDLFPHELVTGKPSANGDEKNFNRPTKYKVPSRRSKPTVLQSGIINTVIESNKLWTAIPIYIVFLSKWICRQLFRFLTCNRTNLSRMEEPLHVFIHEEPNLFEDPCYVPDPVSFLRPVSESLDNFQLDVGTGFAKEMGLERPRALKKVSASSEVNKLSPIESPMSREKHTTSNWFTSTTRAQAMHTASANDSTANETGTWQMWNTYPIYSLVFEHYRTKD
ncbi:hypothetical protein CJ030_MR2G009991 [Morella rubra]|uniref:Uncharacterized protein n=1 Tax=Morella rubra TaxID=262757 RepID=A0A6A1WP70_9ROSI|nr:hypothetical protein CJ030_MR2G009991 [Morella rubra]